MPRQVEPTIENLVRQAARRLSDAGIEDPRPEAWRLLAYASGLDRAELLARSGTLLDDPDIFLDAVARRAGGEPFAYITGRRAFWDLDLEVGPGTLIPRPETECVIEEALARLPERDRPLRILDLGTGTGCLAVTLLHLYPKARGIAVDRSGGALHQAQRNAVLVGVDRRLDLVCGNWAFAIEGSFDLIVSNPPYIASGEHPALAPEVRLFEPEEALLAGADGLDSYRAIAPELPRLLAQGGLALFEIGMGQRLAVQTILEAMGSVVLGVRRDLAGIERCVAAGRKGGT